MCVYKAPIAEILVVTNTKTYFICYAIAIQSSGQSISGLEFLNFDAQDFYFTFIPVEKSE